jgi:hypothetical protein
MKLVGLVPSLAALFRRDPVKLNVIALRLRTGGLITTGGRGPGGAEMQPSDGINFLLACMIDGPAKDAPDAVREARSLPLLTVHEGLTQKDGARTYEQIGRQQLPTDWPSQALGVTLDAAVEAMMFGQSVSSRTYPGVMKSISLAFSPPDDWRLYLTFSSGTDYTLTFGAKHRNNLDTGFRGITERKVAGHETFDNMAKMLSIPSPDAKIVLTDASPKPTTKSAPKRKPRKKA